MFQLGANLVLTRLLVPEAFGLMALVNVVVTGLVMLSDLGIAPSIVQNRRGDDAAFLDTAWTAQIARGVVLWLVACALAAPTAAFYALPELARLLPVMGLMTVIAGFESTSIARFQRHLQLGRLAAIELGSQLAGIAVMFVWAWHARTVWALVAGGLAGAATRTLLSHALGERRDRFGWEPGAARDLLSFGKWIFLSTLLAFLSTQLDRLLFGKTIPLPLLGVYSIAAMFAMMPSELLTRLGSTVVFPALSRKRDDADLGAAFRRAKLPLLALAGLVIAPLAAAGGALIEVLYDPRYAEAGWILQVLACGTWFRVLEVPPGAALLALGQPRWVAAGHAAKVAGIAAFVPLGFALGGFPGAVVGLAASQLLLYATAAVGAHRHGLGRVADDAASSLLLAAAIGGGLWADAQLAGLAAPALARLVGGAAGAGLVWTAGLALWLHREGISVDTLWRRATGGSR